MSENLNLNQDIDPQETQEWLESLEAVLEQDGVERAHHILEALIDKARRNGAHLPYTATTAYLNTIPSGQEPQMPGDRTIESRIRSAIRWNALAMVVRGSKKDLELGGHISSFASSAKGVSVSLGSTKCSKQYRTETCRRFWRPLWIC